MAAGWNNEVRDTGMQAGPPGSGGPASAPRGKPQRRKPGSVVNANGGGLQAKPHGLGGEEAVNALSQLPAFRSAANKPLPGGGAGTVSTLPAPSSARPALPPMLQEAVAAGRLNEDEAYARGAANRPKFAQALQHFQQNPQAATEVLNAAGVDPATAAQGAAGGGAPQEKPMNGRPGGFNLFGGAPPVRQRLAQILRGTGAGPYGGAQPNPPQVDPIAGMNGGGLQAGGVEGQPEDPWGGAPPINPFTRSGGAGRRSAFTQGMNF